MTDRSCPLCTSLLLGQDTSHPVTTPTSPTAPPGTGDATPDLADTPEQSESRVRDGIEAAARVLAAQGIDTRGKLDLRPDAAAEVGEILRDLPSGVKSTPDHQPKGIRRCPDCGSTYFGRDGAKALDEAREEGRRAGIGEAAKAVAAADDADEVFTLTRACSRIRALAGGDGR